MSWTSSRRRGRTFSPSTRSSPLSLAAERIGPDPLFQGNLDNAMLGAPKERIEEGAAAVLRDAPRGRGRVSTSGTGFFPIRLSRTRSTSWRP